MGEGRIVDGIHRMVVAILGLVGIGRLVLLVGLPAVASYLRADVLADVLHMEALEPSDAPGLVTVDAGDGSDAVDLAELCDGVRTSGVAVDEAVLRLIIDRELPS